MVLKFRLGVSSPSFSQAFSSAALPLTNSCMMPSVAFDRSYISSMLSNMSHLYRNISISLTVWGWREHFNKGDHMKEFV